MSEWSGAILKSFTFYTTLDKIGDSYPYLVGNSHTPPPHPLPRLNAFKNGRIAYPRLFQNGERFLLR